MDNNTWVLVTPPKGRKILSSRWVFVVKYTGTGEIDRFKARQAIKGLLHDFGIDYNEIFSPVIRMEPDLEVHQINVKTAFLNGYLEEETYMAQPEGFKIPGKEHVVCKLLKSLYGLKQAPRVWYQTLSAFLKSLGFLKLIKDRLYVDDLLIIAPTPALVSELKSALKKRFSMSDLGEVKYLLGWSIQRDRKNRTIFIHQHKDATKVIDCFSDYIPHPIATPAERNAKRSVSS
ncbi:Transposable element [Phytophthora megakarya]|uniref:Transposable element n=1 Tax=Phytophthora megakarya TaxID=4795 RepID=A0A225UZ62_9STRA|nr:Transposable element [Phytophthora megakarya]